MEKHILKSKTIWGVIITVLGVVGIPIPLSPEEGDVIIHSIFEVVGVLLTIIGRLKATGPVGFSFRK